MASLYQSRLQKLIGWGFSNFEAKELVEHYIINKHGNRQKIGYTLGQMRSIPYLQNIVKARRLFVINQRNKLIPEEKIRKNIKQNYIKKGHVNDKGKPDIWVLLRDIREKSIKSGEYHPPKKKGSHHPTSGERGYKKYKTNAKEQKRKLSNARDNASMRGNVNSWIKELESNKKKALDRGDKETADQIDRQINNLRKSQ